MIKNLWNLVNLNDIEDKSNNSSVTNSAFESLSKFKKSDFKCSHLPLVV